MGKIEDLISRVSDVSQKTDEVLSQEKKIEDQEEKESAELQKLQKISRQLQSSNSEDVLEEEIQDFAEAVNLASRISGELEKTCIELNQILDEMHGNSTEELKIVKELADSRLTIESSGKVQELTESINQTEVNTEKTVKEIKKARDEAEAAEEELKNLISLDKYIKHLDRENHDLGNLEQDLKHSRQQLSETKQILSSVLEKAEKVESTNQETITEVGNNINSSRRRFVKGAGAMGATALAGLAGCSSEARQPFTGGGHNDNDSRNKIISLCRKADKAHQEAIELTKEIEPDHLPDKKSIEKMLESFEDAKRLYGHAEQTAEERGEKDAAKLIYRLIEINETYVKGAEKLMEAWKISHDSTKGGAEEALSQYQELTMEANQMERVTEDELKKALES